MATPQNGGNGPDAQYQRAIEDNPAIRYWEDPDGGATVAERSRIQVELIQQAFKEAGVPLGVHLGADGLADYLYRPGVVLTRDEDAPRVRATLGLDRDVDKSADTQPRSTDERYRRRTAIAGLTPVVVPTERDTPDVLDELDTRLGVGVAVPDHLLHVSPVWCNVIEPVPASGDFVPGNPDKDAGRGGLVVVVDTGSLDKVIADRPWLHGVTGEEEPPTVGHYTGHGTFIAGVVRSWAPAADVNVQAVLSIGGAAFESDVVGGLVDALDLVPDVISLSGGTRSRRGVPLLSFEVFWEQRLSQQKGTVLVACAGNDGDRGPFWPAAFPWAVSVGALDEEGEDRAGYSNHGSWVDVYALGTAVVNAYPDGPYTYREPPRVGDSAVFDTGLATWSGTSFAAPMVAGLAVARRSWSGESGEDAVAALIEAALAEPAPTPLRPRLRDATEATEA